MREINVTIIGFGPRGLSVFERIVGLVKHHPRSAKITIHLIDPGESGQGSHPARQPCYLLTNTLASQVTLFPLVDIDDPGKGNTGPSFTEWARLVGYRRFRDRYCRVHDQSGREIGDGDYLPRFMLGEYLTWFYDQLANSMPDGLSQVRHRHHAVDMSMQTDRRWAVRLENDRTIISDYVFIATGHCENRHGGRETEFQAFVARNAKANTRLAFIKGVYPGDRLGRIDPQAIVAIEGFGLTAHDVICELTVGRGGAFVEAGGQLRYEGSGREPRLFLFSRNSLPYAARGVNQKGVFGRHELRFFTRSAIEQLRAKALATRDSVQLDFEAEVLPLLKKEMAYAFRCAAQDREVDAAAFEPTSDECASIERILYPLRDRRFEDFEEFRSYILRSMAADLAEAYKGNLASPFKAATDVIRDARDSICAAVEYGGLTPASHRIFVETYIPLMNRVSFGPPRHRIAELLALINAGVLDLAGGPSSRIRIGEADRRFIVETQFEREIKRTLADVLIIARLDVFRPEQDASALMGNLIRKGLVRPYRNGPYHPGGLDIDGDYHPVSASGQRWPDIWVIGYPAEGAHFYTHALPRPMRRARHLLDAEKCVREMLHLIEIGEQTRSIIAKSRVA